jgi:serine/threonine protein phosphatase PrpC
MSSPTAPSSPTAARVHASYTISELQKPGRSGEASEDFLSLFETTISYEAAVKLTAESVAQTVKITAEQNPGSMLCSIVTDGKNFTTFNIGDSRVILVARNTEGKFATIDLTQDHNNTCNRIKTELELPDDYIFQTGISGFIGRFDAGPRKTTPDVFSADFTTLIECSPLARQGFAPYDVIVTSDGILDALTSDYSLSFSTFPVSLENASFVKSSEERLRKITEIYSDKGIIFASDLTRASRPGSEDDLGVIVLNVTNLRTVIIASACDGHAGKREPSEPNPVARTFGLQLQERPELTCLTITGVAAPAAVKAEAVRPNAPRFIFDAAGAPSSSRALARPLSFFDVSGDENSGDKDSGDKDSKEATQRKRARQEEKPSIVTAAAEAEAAEGFGAPDVAGASPKPEAKSQTASALASAAQQTL